MVMPGWSTVPLPRGVGMIDVFGSGDIVRVAGVGRLTAGDRTVVAGVAATGGAAESGQVTPAPTATAALHRVITVKAPIERRAMSPARDPVTCHLPETPLCKTIGAKISADTPCLSVVDLSLHDYAAAGHWGHTCDVVAGLPASQ
jgi:hypothetical protein